MKRAGDVAGPALWPLACFIVGLVQEIARERLRGIACPLCSERTRNLTAHIWVDHAEAGGS